MSESPASRHKELSPAVASRRLSYLRVIDVRQPEEFHGELGHVPGSRLIPLDHIKRVGPDVDRDAPILVTCRSGRRSSEACRWLASAGYRDVYNLVGGLLAWNAAGLPVCRHAHVTTDDLPRCDAPVGGASGGTPPIETGS